MTINIIVLFLILMVVPEVVGMLYTGFLPEERNVIAINWGAGFIILWGLFEIIVLPLIYLKKSLNLLCMVYGGIIVLCMIVGVVRSRERIIPMVKQSISSIRSKALIGWGNVLLILGQVYIYLRYMHIDDDDAFYVGAAATAVSTNTIFSIDPYTGMEFAKLPSRYVLSPFFSFIAFLSRISGVHPAVVTHLVLAGILIVLSYTIYALVGRKLFPDSSKLSEYFLFFVILIILFSGYTVYTQGMFTLVRIWQGKAVFCAVLVPMISYIMLHLASGRAFVADWCFLFLLMCACCLVSSMGIMLGAIMLGIFGILHVIRDRDFKKFFCTALCCLPNIVCAGLYLVIH